MPKSPMENRSGYNDDWSLTTDWIAHWENDPGMPGQGALPEVLLGHEGPTAVLEKKWLVAAFTV